MLYRNLPARKTMLLTLLLKTPTLKLDNTSSPLVTIFHSPTSKLPLLLSELPPSFEDAPPSIDTFVLCYPSDVSSTMSCPPVARQPLPVANSLPAPSVPDTRISRPISALPRPVILVQTRRHTPPCPVPGTQVLPAAPTVALQIRQHLA